MEVETKLQVLLGSIPFDVDACADLLKSQKLLTKRALRNDDAFRSLLHDSVNEFRTGAKERERKIKEEGTIAGGDDSDLSALISELSRGSWLNFDGTQLMKTAAQDNPEPKKGILETIKNVLP